MLTVYCELWFYMVCHVICIMNLRIRFLCYAFWHNLIISACYAHIYQCFVAI